MKPFAIGRQHRVGKYFHFAPGGERFVADFRVSGRVDHTALNGLQCQLYSLGFIDLINSTEIASSLPPEKMVKYYEIFLNSIVQVAESFNANIIKNLGDSILFYFPDNKKKDLLFFENCMDCCMNIMNKKSEINSKMKKEGLPNVNFRVRLFYISP